MQNKGFTLIELIIVISILLIIIVFAVPGITGYQERQNEEQFVNQLINKLREYQLLSITKDLSTKIQVNSSSVLLCENTDCETLDYKKDIFQNLSPSPTLFYFNEFGDTANSNNIIITNDIVLNTNNFLIKVNSYGGIIKESK